MKKKMEFDGVIIHPCRTKIAQRKKLKFWFVPPGAEKLIEHTELVAIQYGNAAGSLVTVGRMIQTHHAANKILTESNGIL